LYAQLSDYANSIMMKIFHNFRIVTCRIMQNNDFNAMNARSYKNYVALCVNFK